MRIMVRMRAGGMLMRIIVPRTRMRTVASAFTVWFQLRNKILNAADTSPLGGKIVINTVRVND